MPQTPANHRLPKKNPPQVTKLLETQVQKYQIPGIQKYPKLPVQKTRFQNTTLGVFLFKTLVLSPSFKIIENQIPKYQKKTDFKITDLKYQNFNLTQVPKYKSNPISK